ncbi:GNAT family N-acetyltransferase [Halomonas sp. KG2]|uniref:GNAT family N-acetyltransferase n=1 Tax=Halomonas sp. KG2 TaxID=2951138 RepID=UPI0026489D0F|nr:GNAT family N-acetyltransferase [Halomonas sp. KG2]WKD29922.1 GNAT family N-acetyltransferase [Halomonas sp. KG2]
MVIRLMMKEDLPSTALVHKLAFVRQNYSNEWLECNLNAFSRCLIYVAEIEKEIVGYIIWVQKSGFRPEAVLELEQLAVMPSYQGKGIGRKLIIKSLPKVKSQLALKHSFLKHILVTTRADNYAQELYKSTLGAEVETTISNLYSADEVLMIARNISK